MCLKGGNLQKEENKEKEKPIRNLMRLFSSGCFFFFSPFLALYIIRRREKALVYVAVRAAQWHGGGGQYGIST